MDRDFFSARFTRFLWMVGKFFSPYRFSRKTGSSKQRFRKRSLSLFSYDFLPAQFAEEFTQPHSKIAIDRIVSRSRFDPIIFLDDRKSTYRCNSVQVHDHT